MLFWVLSFVVAVLVFIDVYFNYNTTARLLRKVPGPDYVFVLGDALTIYGTPVKVFGLLRKYCNKWDRIFRLWSFSFGAVNIYKPEDIEVILSTIKYNEKSFVYSFLKPWLQDGLLISKGQKWHERRKLMTPAFHFDILKRFFVVIQENSQRLLDTLENCSGENIDVIPLISEFTLNSICETAMGTRFSEELADKGQVYKNAIYELARTVVDRTTRVLLYTDFVFNFTSLGKLQRKCIQTIHNFTKKVIKERKQYVTNNMDQVLDSGDQNPSQDSMYLNKKRRRPAMLDLLILAEKDNLIDDVGIQEEVDTFMFEGHDTTATGLTFCLMLLALHEDVQNKIFEELHEILGDSDRSICYDDLSKMKYLECCIKESLRLYPPVPFISRQLTEPTVLADYKLPGDILCHIHIYDLHRRKDLYPNPLSFDPDRFLPENSIGRHPFAYIPFSAGPRNCIGQRFAMMEMKCVVSSILREFELQPVTRRHDLHIGLDLVLRNNGPVYVTFKKRNQTIVADV